MNLDPTHSQIPGSPAKPIEVPTTQDPIPSPSRAKHKRASGSAS